MLLPLFFFTSLLALSLMLYLRIWRIRQGAVVPESAVIRLPEINAASLRNTTAFYAKRGSHMLILITLKAWIKVSYFMRRKMHEIEPKIRTIIRKRIPEIEKKSAVVVSSFLSNISEYKKKLKHAHDEMKKEEELRSEN